MNQTNKIVWLVDTIHKAGKISYCELNDKWVRNEKFSDGIDLSKRTLHKWIDVIFDTFGIDDFAKLHSIAETAMKNGNSKFNAILAVVKQ